MSGELSNNTNINIRSGYVLHQQNGPRFHELLPYHAPPVFPKAPKHHRRTHASTAGSEAGDRDMEDDGDSYQSIYRNWPQQIDDEIDDMFLARPPSTDASQSQVNEHPIVDGALSLAGDEDDYFIIRKTRYPILQRLNEEQRAAMAEIKHRAAVDAALARCSTRTAYVHSADHCDFVDSRVKRCLAESERQTAELLAATRVNTARESEERDERKKHIRHRLFLKSNSPFSAAQSVVVSRLEEKLYATSPIDLLAQKNRTRCQYSNLPVIRHLNSLAVEEDREKEQCKGLNSTSAVLAEARRRRNESQSRGAMGDMSVDFKRAIRGKSATAIGAALYAESMKNIKSSRNVHEANQECMSKCESVRSSRAVARQARQCQQGYESEEECMNYSGSARARATSTHRTIHLEMMDDRAIDNMHHNVLNNLEACRYQLKNLSHTSSDMYAASSKQTAIEIEQLNARLVEAETKLKTEIARIKKKMMITITELEMSLDVANKTNIDLQKTIKKQSLQLTEIQAHYDDIQRQLQQTLDQYAVATRRIASLVSEVDEVRANYESALRGKKSAEIACEEAGTRITELSTINVSLASMKSKLEQELSVMASDYEEVSRELRASDERYQKVQVELKSTIEILHEEQERIVKIETIKKSLEVEVKNLSVRLEEVEANAVVGAKRVISKMEARIRDLELELEEEKRRHAETIKILRKKERTVKEIVLQCEEDQKNVLLLQESLDKANQKITIYKRQLTEQEGMSQQSVTRARRFQRELEAAEDRADVAESSLNMVRAKHRSFVTTSTVPGGAVYVVESTRTITE